MRYFACLLVVSSLLAAGCSTCTVEKVTAPGKVSPAQDAALNSSK
jgi:uncharacterized lipoprotein YajG